MTNELVSAKNRAIAVQSALYYLCNSQPFYGSLLQELTLKYSYGVPTAGITFNKDREQFEIYLNPEFFCGLTTDERVAVLHHEILHFTNKHLFRLPFLSAKEEDRKLYNMAGDMAINQYIPHLPKGCIDVKDWKLDKPSKNSKGEQEPFPPFKSMEEYYELLKKNPKANEENFKNHKSFDEHDWSQLDEETKRKMLEEAKKVLKRTIEKTAHSHTSVPDSIKDLLQEIETLGDSLNYKQILKQVLKRTVSATDRESTWKRPNKRYGLAAPGTKIGMLPKLAFFNDSSGSISVTEQNVYLRIMDEFLKVGARSCTLGFWHTSLYYKEPYKRGREVESDKLESGGTDVRCVLEDIKKNNYNLSIIFTDGYYDNVDIELTNEVLWIISSGGNTNHPLNRLGRTILLDGLK